MITANVNIKKLSPDAIIPTYGSADAPANKVGVVDSDYRGEIMVSLHNHSDIPQTIEKGERIAQLVITPSLRGVFNEVGELSDTVRGEGGFGSTGTK